MTYGTGCQVDSNYPKKTLQDLPFTVGLRHPTASHRDPSP